MLVDKEKYLEISRALSEKNVVLVAVSKTRPAEAIQELYDLGHRDFGENYVQELVEKQAQLPNDIRWHFIGHLQTNKVKYIAPFVHLIHGVDSFKLLKEIDKQGSKHQRILDALLQVHIAQEETKFGLDEKELTEIFSGPLETLRHVRVRGLMGMASFTEDAEKIREEFHHLKSLFDKFSIHDSRFTAHDSRLTTLSMGMSSDYALAVEEGSTMVRIGSLIFGARNYGQAK